MRSCCRGRVRTFVRYHRSMPKHLRFKRHLRFLREGEVVRVVRELGSEAQLPAGEAFDHLLAALRHGPEEDTLRAELSHRMNVDAGMVEDLVARLFELKLIERFDPERNEHARFDRQLLLLDAFAPADEYQEVDARQRRLNQAHVLVLGLGGIGHQVALSLAAAGLGTLTLVDDDVVEQGNLHRQILFAPSDVGRSKVEAARDGILRIAPRCIVQTRAQRINSAQEWRELLNTFGPSTRSVPPCHIMLSADDPVQLVNWLSDARVAFDYHFIKCGYMTTQGLIGPLLGPDTKGYDELFTSWGELIDGQPENIKTFNAASIAPTMAASNAIMANIAALDLIKHVSGSGAPTLLERRLLLDLNDFSTQFG